MDIQITLYNLFFFYLNFFFLILYFFIFFPSKLFEPYVTKKKNLHCSFMLLLPLLSWMANNIPCCTKHANFPPRSLARQDEGSIPPWPRGRIQCPKSHGSSLGSNTNQFRP